MLNPHLQLDEDEINRWRRDNLGRLLIRAFEAFQADVLEGFLARGIIELERTDLPVLRNLDLAGNRMSEIAERAGLSKQTIGPLVRELEDKGVVRVDPDPSDGRAKVVRFTEKGLEAFAVAVEVIDETSERYTESLGTRRMGQLRTALHCLLEHFERTTEEESA